MNISIRHLRAHTKEIIETVSRGVTVIITCHGYACAQLEPIKTKIEEKESDQAFGMWKDHKDLQNVKKYVRTLRKGRSFDTI